MIPLYKLEKLPRTQKLRKIAKVLSMAENRLGMAIGKGAEIFSDSELVFFTDAAKLLAKDTLFPQEAQKAFVEAANFFGAAIATQNPLSFSSTGDKSMFRRVLNSVKHILLTETGRDQADWDFVNCSGQLDSQKRHVIDGMCVYMEDIRSPFNVGAMFRTAESFGVEKIILSPFCADPNHQRAKRTAMGCIDIIPWEKRELFSGENKSLEFLSGEKSSLPIFALETGGIPIDKFPFPNRGLLITGSEELGVSPNALAAADASLGRVSIPCHGTKASLNVSVAFGIAIQTWCAQIKNL